MRPADLALLTIGGALVTSGLKKAEQAAVGSYRSDVLRNLDLFRSTWRRRAAGTSSTAGMVVGGILVATVLLRMRRDLVAAVRDVEETAPDTDESPPVQP